MKTTKTTETKCWYCGNVSDHAADIQSDEKPCAGAVSLCIMCATPSVFNEDLTTRRPTLDEMAEIIKSPEVVRHMLAIGMVHGDIPPGSVIIVTEDDGPKSG